jgi:beta-mannosidase
MKRIHDLAGLKWTVEGYTPHLWLFEWRHGTGFGATERCIDVRPVPAQVPGSVQGALRAAGLLPDWNVGVHSRDCEWVEHRHGMYRARIPAEWLDPQDGEFRMANFGLRIVQNPEFRSIRISHFAFRISPRGSAWNVRGLTTRAGST